MRLVLFGTEGTGECLLKRVDRENIGNAALESEAEGENVYGAPLSANGYTALISEA